MFQLSSINDSPKFILPWVVFHLVKDHPRPCFDFLDSVFLIASDMPDDVWFIAADVLDTVGNPAKDRLCLGMYFVPVARGGRLFNNVGVRLVCRFKGLFVFYWLEDDISVVAYFWHTMILWIHLVHLLSDGATLLPFRVR